MDIVSKLLEEKQMNKYQLSKMSGVPYSTISDICSGKTDIKKVSAETLIRLSHIFKVKPEEMIGKIDYPANKEKSKKSSKKNSNKVNINETDGIELKVDINVDEQILDNICSDAKNILTKETEIASEININDSVDITTDNETVVKVDINSTDSLDSDSHIKINEKKVDKVYINRRNSSDSDSSANNDYDSFKQKISDKISDKGELNFLISSIKSNTVVSLYNNGLKNESKYLLTLIDDFCEKYKFPVCKEYDYIRKE